MSYKQIDEQFMKKFEYISRGYHCSQPDFDDLKSFLHLIYDQAKREAINDFYHRVDCNTLISELEGWRGILDMSKEEALNSLTPDQSKESK